MFVHLMEVLLNNVGNVSEFLFSFIDILAMYFFFAFVLHRKKINNMIYCCSIIMLSLILTAFAFYNSFSSLNMVFRTLMAFAFGMVFFDDGMRKKLFYISIYSVISIFVELFLFYIIELLFGIQATINLAIYSGSIERIVFKCMTKVIIIFILYFIAKRREMEIKVPFRYMAFILGIYGFSVIALMFLFEICLRVDLNTIKVTLAAVSVTSICIMLSDIFVFIVFEMLCTYFKDKQTSALIEHQKNLTEKYILENEKNYKEIRKLWHDLSNHLSIIQAYLYENQSDKATQYIDEVQAKFHNVPMIIKTGNEIADIVINQKKCIAQEKGINFEVDAFVNTDLNISASELCILLSNSLDNAIEASETILEEEKRRVHVKIKNHKQFLMIEIENFTKSQPIYKNGLLMTCKKDTLNHGLGILSMESIVKKYGGTIEHKYENGRFRLTILLSIQQFKQKN